MKLLFPIAAAALALVVPAAPAAAQSETFSESDTFMVMRNTDDRTCGLIQMWDHPEYGETTLMMFMEPEASTPVFFLFEAANTGMPREGGEATLQVDFVKEDVTDASGAWGMRDFIVLEEEEGKHAFFTQLFGDDRERLLSDFGSYDAVGFHHGDKLLAAMPLDGGAEAITSLRQCLVSLG